MDNCIRVAVVEDDERYRKMVVEALRQDAGLELTGEFGDGVSFLSSLDDNLPDVTLMDVQLPGLDGITTLRQARQKYEQLQFIMLTVYEEADVLFNALRSGATGYLLKQSSPEEISQAIHEVKGGGSPMSTAIARKVVQSFQWDEQKYKALQPLSDREREILEYLSQGYRYKEIAAKLFLSVETIRTHIRNMYVKLQVNSRTEAINKIRPSFNG